jgi:hypothetical protein
VTVSAIALANLLGATWMDAGSTLEGDAVVASTEDSFGFFLEWRFLRVFWDAELTSAAADSPGGDASLADGTPKAEATR